MRTERRVIRLGLGAKFTLTVLTILACTMAANTLYSVYASTRFHEKQLLERMVTARVLNQAGKDTGVRVDDVQLDRAIGRLAQENRMSQAEFRMALEQDGVEYAVFREQIRGEIVASRLRDREVESRITVSDGQLVTTSRAIRAIWSPPGRGD
jgi:parvulin-like peptidyl-prolyl isomerase